MWCLKKKSTFLLIREGKIPPNWTSLVQNILQSGAQEIIDLKDTWFTPYIEEDPSKTLRLKPITIQKA